MEKIFTCGVDLRGHLVVCADSGSREGYNIIVATNSAEVRIMKIAGVLCYQAVGVPRGSLSY